MKSNTTLLHLLHPRFWGMWLLLGVLRILLLLPWHWQMHIGKAFGWLMYQLLGSRRHVAETNIKLAFPELIQSEQKQVCRQHFYSLGQGLFDLALSWWASDKQLQALATIEGKEHLERALQQDNGIILLSLHFTSLEVGGPLVSLMSDGLHVVYKPHKNAVLEYLVAKIRSRRYGKAIPKNQIRGMISSLKKGHTVWFAPDQSFQDKNSVDVPFFCVEVPTNPSTSRLAAITKSQVVPFITVRDYDENNRAQGYILRFLPALQDFPSDNLMEDTQRTNLLFEKLIREFPSQYLWTHKRYKHADIIDENYQIKKL